jgi:hypothetical protein
VRSRWYEEAAWKTFRCVGGVYKRQWIATMRRHQAIKSPTSIHFKSHHTNHLQTHPQNHHTIESFTMNNLDSHPRVLSLSTSRSPSSTSTPQASNTATPVTQSRRASHESAHDAHHFIALQDKTSNTLNGSIKKIWKEIKHHAAEHHRSVNMAYRAQYGGGARMDLGRPSGL